MKNLRDELEKLIQMRTHALTVANQELEAFSYSVSHDLRAPLRSIDGFAQALTEDFSERLDAQGKHYLERIRHGTQCMSKLIDDLLKLANLTQSPIEFSEVNLSFIAETIACELKRSQPNRVVEFVIEPEVTVIGDQGLLKIMLDNLIGNAWKYTSKHETARIEFGRMIGKQGLTFFIKDDGVGFNMAYSDKLFGAFQRLHSADEFSGTGVGLATVRRIVHRHGGEVWAESNPKVSTTFYFTLEQQEREQTDEQPKENYSLSGGQSRRR